MKKSRSSTVSTAAAAAWIVILTATTTFAQPSSPSMEGISLEPGSLEGALDYRGGVQHQLIAPYVQSVGPYVHGFQGALDGVEHHAIFTGSFGIEDFPNLDLIHGNGAANWEVIREMTQMTTPEWVHPTDAIEFQSWQ